MESDGRDSGTDSRFTGLAPVSGIPLQALLADERARRERFYEEMTEQQKVEFINGAVLCILQ